VTQISSRLDKAGAEDAVIKKMIQGLKKQLGIVRYLMEGKMADATQQSTWFGINDESKKQTEKGLGGKVACHLCAVTLHPRLKNIWGKSSLSLFRPKIMVSISSIISMCLLVCIAVSAHAASFDCAKAKSVMEKTICSDEQLSRLDEELNQKYNDLKSALKDRPKQYRKVVSGQKEWLRNLKPEKGDKTPCVGRIPCLRDSFIVRNRDLQYELAKARAVAPSEEEVRSRLSLQYQHLKKYVHKLKYASMLGVSSSDRKCADIWAKINKATIPKPIVFARTTQQKTALYEVLRKQAYHNRHVYLSDTRNNPIPKHYDEKFRYQWRSNNTYKEFEVADDRNDQVIMMFEDVSKDDNYHNNVIVTVLMDVEDIGLAVSMRKMGNDGLYTNESAHSNEYHYEYLLKYPQGQVESAGDHMGLFILDNEIYVWCLYLDNEINEYKLFIVKGSGSTDPGCVVSNKK
jgi:hypothetical protein